MVRDADAAAPADESDPRLNVNPAMYGDGLRSDPRLKGDRGDCPLGEKAIDGLKPVELRR